MNTELQNYRPIPFFFLNTTDPEALSLSSAETLMHKMKEAGYGGALLFNKPPTGFDQELYLSQAWYNALENFCIAAKKEGLVIWMNDGWNFPPGDAGGRILKADPSLDQYHLEQKKDGSIQPVKTEWGFPAFEEPRSAELFHEFVYEGLAAHLGKYFGDPLVGIFSDADNRRINAFTLKKTPSQVYFPWSKTLPEQFQAKFGYDLMPHLQEIYVLADKQVSTDYWMLVSELYQNWFASNYRWCQAHGLRYSFHTSDTGPLDPQVCRRSSAFSEGETLKLAQNCDYPGTDHELFVLDGGTHYDNRYFVPEVSKGGGLERWHHPAFSDTSRDVRAKVVASAAYLYGKKRTLCEAFAATNWEASPEKLRRIASWQIMQGINFFVPHAVHVKLFGSTKFFAPPEFLHGFPMPALREFNDFLAKFSMIAAQGEYRPRVAVLDPTPRLWRGKTPGKFFEICDKLNRMAVDYVITDQAHAGQFQCVIDPDAGMPSALPEPYASFSGGDLAYYRRFLPDGTSYFLAANLWNETTLTGELTTAGRKIALELAPGEIAVIGGPWESYRSPLNDCRTQELPQKWNVVWGNPQRIGFTHSFCWENSEAISDLRLLLPEGTSAKLNGEPLSNGKKTLVFEDVYMEYTLPGEAGLYQIALAEVSFETPIYLSGDFEVQYSTVNDFHKPVYELYNLRIFEPEKETLKLSRRKPSLVSGSWTDQGHPFYSGKATYQCEFTAEFQADYLELSVEGVLCEASLDGVSLGEKTMSPCIFSLKQCQPGQHILTVSVTNTLGNQLEQIRVPSGLMAGRLLKIVNQKSGRKKMKTFHGIIPPSITPLNAKNEVDVSGLEHLLEHMMKGGIHGVFVLGTTGEGPALGRQQQEIMIRESVRIIGGRIPVLAGISSASFQDSVDLAVFAKKEGVSAVVAAPPCYFNLGESELVDYYHALSGEISMPLFIYNMPSMTKVYLRPPLVQKLAGIPGICGYKDSSGNMADFHEVLLALKNREDFSIFMGPEELLGEAVLFGADGGVSGGANLAPEIFVKMYDAARQGNVVQMQSLQKRIYEQRKLYALGHHQSSMIKGVKSALKALGICEDCMIRPFNHFERPEADAVRGVLKTCGYDS